VVVTGAECRETYACEENAIRWLQTRQACRLTVAVDVVQAPQANDQEWQVRRHVPEVVHGEQSAKIGELMVCRILGDRRGQQETDNYERERCGDNRNRACGKLARFLRLVSQMPIFARRSANSLAMRSATG